MLSFLYGTAWKELETARLTRLAIEQGFRAIDTANQRKHYFEAAVGEAVAGAIADGIVTREQLFLQTKFTYAPGQDHRLPYDREADPRTQVQQSFASSLEHLGVERIDSYVLHGPSSRMGWQPVDRTVWEAMEELHASGSVSHLGISNVGLGQLESLCERSVVPPSFVQNRCFARLGWDREVRNFCSKNAIVYQGFSLLTANARELTDERFLALARRVSRTPAQVVFRFATQVGMLPLTGTSNPVHMREDLACFDFDLSSEDLEAISNFA